MQLRQPWMIYICNCSLAPLPSLPHMSARWQRKASAVHWTDAGTGCACAAVCHAACTCELISDKRYDTGPGSVDLWLGLHCKGVMLAQDPMDDAQMRFGHINPNKRGPLLGTTCLGPSKVRVD